MNNEIDIGQFSEALNNKLDTATFTANTLGVTASANTNSVLTTASVSKTGIGHVKFGNGFMIQWGYNATTGDVRTCTFSIPFTSMSYFVFLTPIASGSANLYMPYVDMETSTLNTFDVRSQGAMSNVGFRWVAFGW